MSTSTERIVGVSTVEERLFRFDYQRTVIRPIPKISCIDEIDDAATEHRPTVDGVCDFLGPDTDFHEPECPRVNRRGLNHLTPINWSIGTRFVTNRREVETDFYQNFEPPIHAAFSQRPLMYSRSDAPPGPMQQERLDMNCGYQLTWPRTSDSLYERFAMIGLFKDPGTIQSTVNKALLQEIRQYAYAYECPQVFVFDSLHLLIVQLKAYNREELKNPKCPYEYCRISRECMIPSQSTIQYGLYALAWRGWMRLASTMVNGPDGEGRALNVVVDGCIRRIQYWSGRPMWERLGKITIQHPNGWFRLLCSPSYNVGCWAWVSRNLDRYFYDTGNLFQ